MGRFLRTVRTAGAGRVLVAVLCVLLVVVAGTAQVAHAHPDKAVIHADCSLCATAHVVIASVQIPIPAPAIAVVRTAEAEPPAAQPATLTTFALFTRPPPAGALPA